MELFGKIESMNQDMEFLSDMKTFEVPAVRDCAGVEGSYA